MDLLSLVAYPDQVTGLAIVERQADGQQWTIDTQERPLNFRPDSQGLLWLDYDEDAPWDSRDEAIWLAEVDGSNARKVFSARRTDPIAWLSNDEVLMARRLPGSSDVELFTLSLENGAQTELIEGPRMRGITLSPDKRYVIYYVIFEDQSDQNGIWLFDLQNPEAAPEKLPFFGTYRWRDNERLIYVPFDPETTEHNFYEYNLVTDQTRPLFPNGIELTIANNDWEVSPDGRQIAFVAANGSSLDGIWVLDIE